MVPELLNANLGIDMTLRTVFVLTIIPHFLQICVIFVVQADHRQRVRFFKYRLGHELDVLIHIELNADQVIDLPLLVPNPDPIVRIETAVSLLF